MITGYFCPRTLLGLQIAREHRIYERVSYGPDPAVQSCTELPTSEFCINDLNYVSVFPIKTWIIISSTSKGSKESSVNWYIYKGFGICPD